MISKLAEVRLDDGEPIDAALRRFKKEVIKDGIIAEVKRRERHEDLQKRKRKRKEEGRVKAVYGRPSNKKKR